VQRLLRLLSDPTRLRILAAVEGEELAVGEIADVLRMSQSRISNHLRLLKEAEALAGRREGAWTFYKNALPEQSEREALWTAVKNGVDGDQAFRADLARRAAVLDKRRHRSREYFSAPRDSTIPNNGESGMETNTVREELLASLLPRAWTVLDAGCGDGYLTEALAARFDNVIAVDHSPERLALARKRLAGSNVEFQEAEIDDLPLRASSIDAVFFSMVLHHVPLIDEAMRESFRVLKPGGFIAVADFSPHQEETMREEMGDLRLGLDPARIDDALTQAGFEQSSMAPARDRFHHPRCGEPLEMFLATGHKPARTRKTKSPIQK
jgi:SAM-dependent methyltransferase